MSPSNDMGLYPEVPHWIIAGLRMLQDVLEDIYEEEYSIILDIATNGGESALPTPLEVDELCEAINVGNVELIGEIW